MDKFAEIQRCVEEIDKESTKFFTAGNKAAGTRARKHLQELKTLAQALRIHIQDCKSEKAQPHQEMEQMPQEYANQGYD